MSLPVSSLNRLWKNASRPALVQPARNTEIAPAADSARNWRRVKPPPWLRIRLFVRFHDPASLPSFIFARLLHLMFSGLAGGGIGARLLNFGECGSWQFTQSR